MDLFGVYVGVTALAAASPTPGNIAAVEVTLTPGLIAIGAPSAAALTALADAVAAALIYRLLTFWLPLVPLASTPASETPHLRHSSAAAELRTMESLTANLLDHLHNRVDRRLWPVQLDVVAAPVGKQLLAIRRQTEEIGLLAIPIQITWCAREHNQRKTAKALHCAGLGRTLRQTEELIQAGCADRGVTDCAT